MGVIGFFFSKFYSLIDRRLFVLIGNLLQKRLSYHFLLIEVTSMNYYHMCRSIKWDIEYSNKWISASKYHSWHSLWLLLISTVWPLRNDLVNFFNPCVFDVIPNIADSINIIQWKRSTCTSHSKAGKERFRLAVTPLYL